MPSHFPLYTWYTAVHCMWSAAPTLYAVALQFRLCGILTFMRAYICPHHCCRRHRRRRFAFKGWGSASRVSASSKVCAAHSQQRSLALVGSTTRTGTNRRAGGRETQCECECKARGYCGIKICRRIDVATVPSTRVQLWPAHLVECKA